MKLERWLNGILWTVNELLGAGVVVFAITMLNFGDSGGLEGWEPRDPGDLARPAAAPPKVDEQALAGLVNPIVPAARLPGGGAAVATVRGVELVGTMPFSGAKDGYVFLKVQSRGEEQVSAYSGQPVTDDEGKPVPELSGWVLDEVYQDRGVFRAGSRTMELRMPREPLETPMGDAGGAWPGARVGGRLVTGPYSQDMFPNTKLQQQTDHAESWIVDPAEIEYAMANRDAIIDKLQLSLYSGGGVQVSSVPSASIAAARGLRTGDVVQTINGVSIANASQLKQLLQGNQIQQQRRMVVMVQRSGRSYTLEYGLGNR